MTRQATLVCLLALIAAVPSIGQRSGTAGAAATPRFGTWDRAFDVRPGYKQYVPPEERVSVW